jgi:hypothetical protein
MRNMKVLKTIRNKKITSSILERDDDGRVFIELDGNLESFNSFKELGEKIDTGEIIYQ